MKLLNGLLKKFGMVSPATTQSLANEIASRDKAAAGWSQFISQLPNPDPVLRKMGKSIEVYRDLFSDARVKSCVKSRRAGVLKRDWGLDRNKAKSREAKIIESWLQNDIDVRGAIIDILKAPFFGYQPIEIEWQLVGNLVVPKSLIGKPPEWFCYNQQNQLLFKSKAKPLGELVPENKFIVPRQDQSYENPYGIPDLAACFWPVVFKAGGLKFWVTFTEKYGMPYLIGKLPRGSADNERDDLLESLEAMVQDAVAVIPDDGSIELMTVQGTTSADIYEKLVRFCKQEIAEALVGHTGAAESTPGKLGGEDGAMQVRSDIVDEDCALVEWTFNEVIRMIYQYNWPGAERPAFTLWERTDMDQRKATRDKTLTDIGVRFTEEYIGREYGLDEEDFTLNEPRQIEPPPGQATQDGDPAKLGVITKKPERFAASKDPVEAIDEAIAAMDPATLQAQAEGLLKPVIDLLNEGKSHEEAEAALSEAYPNLDDRAVADMVARAIFVGEVWGRIQASGKTKKIPVSP